MNGNNATSTANIEQRLIHWCVHSPGGLACVEVVDDLARQRLVSSIRPALEQLNVQLTEIGLPSASVTTPSISIADWLCAQLDVVPAGAVSVSGFETALPRDASSLGKALYLLSLSRERLANRPHRQIWWMAPRLAASFAQAVPDLDSWFTLRLRLDQQVPAFVPETPSFMRDRPTRDPVAARQYATEMLARIQRATDNKTGDRDDLMRSAQAAVAALNEAGLIAEARETELRLAHLLAPAIHAAPQQPPHEQRDFFISYTHTDRAWAEWIAWTLEDAGYRCVIQAWDFIAGTNFVLKMQAAAVECRHTLAVLSPRYLESGFAQPEWAAAFAQDPTGSQRKLLLVRVGLCSPPGMLKPIVHIDLVGKKEAEAARFLLDEINTAVAGARRKPKVAPAFPGDQGSTGDKPVFPGSGGSVFRVPHRRNPNFTGRDKELKAIHGALSTGKTAAITQAIHGLGGVGKTQLALEYCYRHQGDYSVVWWLAAEDTPTLLRDLAELGAAMGVSLPADSPPDRIIAETHAALAQRQPSLLVFDNASNAEAIAPFLPQSGHTLVTSRNPNFQAWGADDINLAVWPKKKAVEFLEKRMGRKDAQAADLAKELGCFPLALEHAGAYIEESKCSVGEHVAMFRKNHKAVLDRAVPPQGYTATVATTWTLSLIRMRATCPNAVDLMKLLAFLDPDAVPLWLLTETSRQLTDSPLSWVGDEMKFNDAVAALRTQSLVDRDHDRLSTHRLVQLVVRDSMADEEQRRWCVVAVNLVNAAFPSKTSDVRSWPRCEELAPHAHAVSIHAGACGATSHELVRIFNQMALYYHAKAFYGEAEPLMRRALEIDEKGYGPDHPYVAIILNDLARLLHYTNRHAEAEPLMRRALAINENRYGPDHPDVANTLNNLAELLKDTNRHAEAEPLMRRALRIFHQFQRSSGHEHPHLQDAIRNYQSLLQKMGLSDEEIARRIGKSGQ